MVTDDRDLARHYRTIYGFVRQRSGSREDAEDVTQTVFVEAAANLTRVYAEGRSPLAWLYTVASRRLIDQARRRGRAPELVPLDAAAGLRGERTVRRSSSGRIFGRRSSCFRQVSAPGVRRRRSIQGAKLCGDRSRRRGRNGASLQMPYMPALGTIVTSSSTKGLEPVRREKAQIRLL